MMNVEREPGDEPRRVYEVSVPAEDEEFFKDPRARKLVQQIIAERERGESASLSALLVGAVSGFVVGAGLVILGGAVL